MDIVRLSLAARNAMLDALTARIDAANGSGIISFYSRLPNSPDSAAGSASLLGQMRFARRSFHPASAGIAEAYPIEPGVAEATGKIAWARLTDSAGNPVIDLNVGLANTAVILNTLDTFVGGPITLTGITLRMAAE